MSDPLAPFRKQPIGSEASNLAQTGKPAHDRGGYLAFAVKERAERLKIHRANDPSRSPYGPPLDIIYDGEFGSNFVLMWDLLIVEVHGRNLQDLVRAIQIGTADYIQEFDADRWDVPKDMSAAFIDSIVVHGPGSNSVIGHQLAVH